MSLSQEVGCGSAPPYVEILCPMKLKKPSEYSTLLSTGCSTFSGVTLKGLGQGGRRDVEPTWAT